MGSERDKKSRNRLYRVRFMDRPVDEKPQPIEVLVKAVGPSEFFGLVCLEGLVFEEPGRTPGKTLILPEEEAIRKRFGRSERLHLPYHNIIFVEEFLTGEGLSSKALSLADDHETTESTGGVVTHLPFIRPTIQRPETDGPTLS